MRNTISISHLIHRYKVTNSILQAGQLVEMILESLELQFQSTGVPLLLRRLYQHLVWLVWSATAAATFRLMSVKISTQPEQHSKAQPTATPRECMAACLGFACISNEAKARCAQVSLTHKIAIASRLNQSASWKTGRRAPRASLSSSSSSL